MSRQYKITEHIFKDGKKKYLVHYESWWFGVWVRATLNSDAGIPYLETIQEAKELIAIHRNKEVNRVIYND